MGELLGCVQALRDSTNTQRNLRSKAVSAFLQDFNDVFLRTNEDFRQRADLQSFRLSENKNDPLGGREAAQNSSQARRSS